MLPGDDYVRQFAQLALDNLEDDFRMVTAYLEVAEIQALNRNPMTMQD